MAAQYKSFADKQSASEAAEAVGRLFASSAATPYPMPPVAYGPGKQPQPMAAYYQKYWAAPLDAVTRGGPLNEPADLPIRIEVDPFCLAQDGKVQVIAGNKPITLDFKNLQSASAQAESLDAKGG
jgi:hypothetical protein